METSSFVKPTHFFQYIYFFSPSPMLCFYCCASFSLIVDPSLPVPTIPSGLVGPYVYNSLELCLFFFIAFLDFGLRRRCAWLIVVQRGVVFLVPSIFLLLVLLFVYFFLFAVDPSGHQDLLCKLSIVPNKPSITRKSQLFSNKKNSFLQKIKTREQRRSRPSGTNHQEKMFIPRFLFCLFFLPKFPLLLNVRY